MCVALPALGLATAMQTAVVGSALAATAVSAYSAYRQSQVADATAAANRRTAEVQAIDAERRGEEKSMEVQRQARQMVGAQRAAFAARGLDLTEGTPASLVEQTDFFGQSDAATARNNARKEAWAIRAQKANFQGGDGGMGAFGSLLGGASGVADKWYSYSNAGKG